MLDLPETGEPVNRVAHDLGLSQQTVYIWREKVAIDQGTQPGSTIRSMLNLPLRGFVHTNWNKIFVFSNANEIS